MRSPGKCLYLIDVKDHRQLLEGEKVVDGSSYQLFERTTPPEQDNGTS
jgi:hypothetical protein